MTGPAATTTTAAGPARAARPPAGARPPRVRRPACGRGGRGGGILAWYVSRGGSRLGRRRAPATPASDKAAGREAAPGPRVSLRPQGPRAGQGVLPSGERQFRAKRGTETANSRHRDGKFLENSRRRWRHVELKARVAARRRQSNSAPVKGKKIADATNLSPQCGLRKKSIAASEGKLRRR